MAKESKGTKKEHSSKGSDFPKHSLSEATLVAQALEDKNGGNPLSPTDIAIALGKSPQSSDYRVQLSSSIKYGLTSGSYNQPKVSLEELGKNIVEPRSDDERAKALIQAALKPVLFAQLYDFYKSKKLPDPAFFKTVLTRDFAVQKEHVNKCVEVFLQNMEYVGLVKQATTGKWLALVDEADLSQSQDTSDEVVAAGTQMRNPPGASETADPRMPEGQIKNAIFVGHGKNKTPLLQLEKILSEYKLPYKIAIDEANVGRPISQKVADIMKECGAAIIIFTTDQEFKDASGNTVYRPSENAIYELGAASALYGSRIVIFRESSVLFPTNFRDIGHIEFEKDKLDGKVNELFRELIGFGLIKVSVGS